MTISNRRMAPRAAMVAITAAAIALTAPVSGALATAGPLFATSGLAAVPAGGAVGALESATFTSISCTSPGDCVAGGSYRTGAGGQQAMIESDTNGTWGAPLRIAPPAGATSAPRNASAAIESVSCSAQGFCEAVGSYHGSGSGMLVAAQSAGEWATATRLPAISGQTGADGVLDSVSCVSPGDCVAVGTIQTTHRPYEPVIATETDGTWGRPSPLTLPSGDLETVATSLSVSCPAAGDCVVAGTDYPASGPQLPLVIVQSGGRWGPPQTLGPLSGSLPDPDQVISVGALDCAAVGQCTAVGNDETAAGASGFALVDSGGSFTEVGLPYPAGSAGFLTISPDLGLDAVGCGDARDCAAGGAYPTAGTPSVPRAAPMTAVQQGGMWSAPTALAAPGGAAAAASGLATVRGLSCPAVADCEGAGGYETAAGQQIPMAVSVVPVLSVASRSLPAARLGRPYWAQLASAGGAGPATWRVTAGTLPVGLSLDPATGVISGTPRFLQRTAFTVEVTDPGPPAQSASASIALRVSATGPPAPRLGRVRILPRRVSAAGRIVGRRCEAITRRNRRHRHCLRTVRLRLRVHLSKAASVRLTATRLLTGRRVRHGLILRCQAPTRRNRHDRRCTRRVRVRGHDTLRLRAGTHRVRWPAVLRGRALRPGVYSLRLVPSAGGRTGRAVAVTVTITG